MKKIIRILLLFLAKDIILSSNKVSSAKEILDLCELLEKWTYFAPYPSYRAEKIKQQI